MGWQNDRLINIGFNLPPQWIRLIGKGKDDDLYIITPVKPGDAVKAATDGVTLEKTGHEADPQAAIRFGM